MVITNQGGGYPTMFSCKQNICNFVKQANRLCLQKLGQKHASKDGIGLAVFIAFGEVLSFGFGVTELLLVCLLAVLLVNGLSFVHTVIYDAHNQDTENKRFIVELDSETIKIWSSENYFQAVPKLS